MPNSHNSPHYVGRFAPSPTGPLHFGSLFAAVISYLDAKQNGGKWLVRIEDIDPLREQKGAAQSILKTLEAHALTWDDNVAYQSDRAQFYDHALDFLRNKQCYFYCPCSRKELAENKGRHSDRCGRNHPDEASALKFRATDKYYHWLDSIQGSNAAILTEDFVLKRKEGYYAYQLAVVCDDLDQNITHVVRGYDLLDSTPMQLALYEAMEKTPPVFAHFPVITENGQKLSKQNLALAVTANSAVDNLLRILGLLSIPVEGIVTNQPRELLDYAVLHWNPSTLNKLTSISLP